MNPKLSPDDLSQIRSLLASDQPENNEIVFNILEGFGLISNNAQQLLNNIYKYRSGENHFKYKSGYNVLDVRVRKNEIHFYLDLQGQQLTALPEGIGSIANLKEMNVSINKLQEFPEELASLQDLEKLNISYNRNINKTCFQVIRQYKKLKVLNISGCGLDVFPEELLDMNTLEVLYCANNNFSTLPPEVSKLENLYYLDLSQNNFNRFPYHLYNSESLESLQFENNKFTQAQITALKRSKKGIDIKF